MTGKWYDSLDKSKEALYGNRGIEEVSRLKQQNHNFHIHFSSMFEKDEDDFLEEFEGWIAEVIDEEANLHTPLPDVLGEFFHTQLEYLNVTGKYAEDKKETVTHEQVTVWNKAIVSVVSKIIQEYTEKNTEATKKRWFEQGALMAKISATVIPPTKNTALLPLVGEINSSRSEAMFGNSKTYKYTVRCRKH